MNRNVYIYIWLLLLYINGTRFFLRGFLLTRHEFHVNSSATDGTSCCLTSEPKYKQIIVLLIDALRYDFLEFDDQPDSSGSIPIYRNNLPVVHQLLKDKQHSSLYQFIADPPTTTLQRLKALTTGSLPTFIDVGSNFASDELIEDNIINQIVTSGMNISFMGDDTWMGLFPKSFRRAYPYPSFDVWDLDTVDRGVEASLATEINQTDWTLLIAHGLGVDHTGHRYGPEHPVMPQKLKEMNALIENIIRSMDSSSLLLVMGDHGMSRNGDHGGDSRDETHAGFFAYSPRWSIRSKSQETKSISQVDLVPTLAVLLGVPIPYSNLGSVILDLIYPEHLLSDSDDQHGHLITLSFYADALSLNVQQVWRYLLSYSAGSSSTFPEEDFELLKDQHSRIMDAFQRMKVPGCRSTCREDSSCCPPSKQLEELISMAQLFLNDAKEMCRAIWAHFDLNSIAVGLIIFLLTLFMHAVAFLVTIPGVNVKYGIACAVLSVLVQNWSDVLALGLNAVPVLNVLSRLERLNDWKSLNPYNFVPLVLAVLYTSVRFVIQEPYFVHHLTQALIWIPVVFRRGADRKQWIIRICLSLVTGLGLNYFRCREEQLPDCEVNSLHRSLTSLSGPGWIAAGRLLLALCSLAILYLLSRRCLPRNRTFLWFIVIAGCYWILQATSVLLVEVDPGLLVLLPRLFYTGFVACLIRQLYYFSLPEKNWRNNTSGLVLLVSTLAILLAGDGLAPGVALTFTAILLAMQLAARQYPELWPLYGLLSLHGFFSTGHHTSLPNIPWETAFVGFSHASSPSIWANILPALLVSYSTAFSFFLHGLALPLLVLQNDGQLDRGRMYFLLFHALRLFGCMGAAAIHRRHLLVWKLFAPRLLYELVLSLYSALGLVVSLCLVPSRR